MKQLIRIFLLVALCLSTSCAYKASQGANDLIKSSEFGNTSQKPVETERKILYSAYIDLSVESPDSTNARLVQIAEQFEGYVQESGTYRAVIRVKSEKLEAALLQIETLGKVRSRKLKGEDVTDNYLDYKIRLENAEKARERYLALLAQAENVEAALKVEKELERLNGEIDLLKGKMNRIDHLATYATITLSLSERKKPGLIGYVGLGLYHAVKWLFVRN